MRTAFTKSVGALLFTAALLASFEPAGGGRHLPDELINRPDGRFCSEALAACPPGSSLRSAGA